MKGTQISQSYWGKQISLQHRLGLLRTISLSRPACSAVLKVTDGEVGSEL